ncbi:MULTISPECIES: NAD+ synthase [Halorussus]|uniref:NAD+ synthase n=1 Tax=Halorussus TaxID=1070314 RepID=UPI000E20DAA8|nr:MULTISPECIES: NAD+ synthase [Halorussus]
MRRSPPVESTAPRDRTGLSPDELRERAATLLRETVEDADAEGVVVNMSGGVDSSATAALAADALGADRVSGLLLPTAQNRAANTRDARQLAVDLGVEYDHVPLQSALDAFERSVGPKIAPGGDRYAVGNLAARLRMACAYFVANATSRLVVGTSNRSERLLGYFTKYGDGGADVLPLADYYKTEVRRLAGDLEVPDDVIEKPPTAGFWSGQTDESELGAPYETLDGVLRSLVDEDRDVPATARARDVDEGRVRQYAATVARTAHKRSRPPTPTRRTAAGDPRPTFASDRAGAARLADRLTESVREYVERADADGVVVNMSGGLDSSAAAALAAEALGPDRVYVLHLPCHKGTDAATVDPGSLATDLGIDYARVNVHPVVSEIERRLPTEVTRSAGTRELGNLVARLRMACAYYVANATSRLVLGTTNRTERLLGYFTKYGDGGVDLRPLGNCYKTEVSALGRYLDLPAEVLDQPPTAGFRAGQTDEGDFGIPYETLDRVLARLVDGDLGVARTADALDLDPEPVRRCAAWHLDTRHKRTVPPTPRRLETTDRPRYFHEVELNFR